MENKKYDTEGTVPKSNRKTIETKPTPLIQIHDRSTKPTPLIQIHHRSTKPTPLIQIHHRSLSWHTNTPNTNTRPLTFLACYIQFNKRWRCQTNLCNVGYYLLTGFPNLLEMSVQNRGGKEGRCSTCTHLEVSEIFNCSRK